VASREVYRNRWTRVREDRLERADGSTGIYGVVEKPDFVVVLPWDGGGYWLVEQYRHPVGGRHWEFPQGSVTSRPLPPPAELAAVELREETGLVAGRMEVLGYLFTSYGTSSQGYHVVLATDLVRGPADLEPEEADLVSAWFPAAEVEAMIADGRVRDAHSVAALALLDRHRRTHPPERG
jgi:8-oxo-dGTP pyrophosphatase MutT (NUDIX family)